MIDDDDILISGPIGFLKNSGSSVFFSRAEAGAGTFKTTRTDPKLREVQTALKVASWGEDNRFPQNIENQMAYCGVGKAGLDWKARMLYGAGIIPGRLKDYKDNGATEVFEPLKRSGADKHIYKFLEDRNMSRFWLEYFQDWTTYANCFPEAILSKDKKTITGWVHQESCDARYRQMNDQGIIEKVMLSKMWGSSSSQFAKFDPDKRVRNLIENPDTLTEAQLEFIEFLPCIDMYDRVDSLREIAGKFKRGGGLKSAILPVNYPSANKTYYQVPYWDGARLGGWVEIACKVPSLAKWYYKKVQRHPYHIEIPETYFEKLYTKKAWKEMDVRKQLNAKKKLLKEMDEFLTGDKNAFNTFCSFFDIDSRSPFTEYGRIKITAIENKNSIEKDLISSSAAEQQILTAMGIHPTLFGAGAMASGAQRTGGSDQREAFLIYCAGLKLERDVAMEPIYLTRDFNGWDDDIVFRVRDIQLTTLDQNKGTQKVVS